MTSAQLLAPSLAAGLVTAGLGIGTITAPGVAEASGLRSTVSPVAAPAETAGIKNFSAGIKNFSCSVFFFLLPGRTENANYRLCGLSSDAPGPARQNLKVAGVFGI
jgi:hypothetical protein